MGSWPKATICFGVDIGNDIPEFISEIEDSQFFQFDDIVCQIDGQKGVDRRETIKSCPVACTHYGGEDYPSYVFFVRGTDQTNSWDSSKEIKPMITNDVQVTEFKAWLEKVGFELPREPKWLLLADQV